MNPPTPEPPSVPSLSTAEVAERFLALAKALRTEANRSLRTHGFTFARGKLLLVLQRQGPLRMTALAQALKITPRSATEAVDALERDRLVTRRPDPSDRRAVLVDLSEHGVAVIQDTADQRARAVDRIFGVLDGHQRAQLTDLLDTLTAAALVDGPGDADDENIS